MLTHRVNSFLAFWLIVPAAALAQQNQPVLKYSQPWTPPLCNYESRADDCASPAPANLFAMDDWVCPQTGPIIRVTWWGWLYPNQGTHQFIIRIFADNGACSPTGGPIYSACVTPDFVQQVGLACASCTNHRRTFRLSAAIPAFNQIAGTRYWLQIIEDDAASIRVGQEDFRWSGHLPIVGCPAMQGPPLAILAADPCDDQNTDLAFKLYAQSIVGNAAFNPGAGHPAIALLNLMNAAGELVETLPLEIGENGRFVAEPSITGSFTARLIVPGAEIKTFAVTLAAGMEVAIPQTDFCVGDTNNDGTENPFDIQYFLQCLNAP